MKKKLLLIYNLRSGKGIIKTKLAQIVDVFSSSDYEVICYSTQFPKDAEKKLMEYSQFIDMAACAGGDGTVNAAVSGIIKSGTDIPLIIIPGGSTNDYAVSLGISKNQIEAARIGTEENFRFFDAGSFNEVFFDYVAAFGLFTDISYATDQNLKNTFGYGAYLFEIAKRIFDIDSVNLSLKIDGESYSGNWFYGMITNSTQVGGVNNITGRNVDLSDGLFEVTLVRETRNPLDFIEALSSILAGIESPFIVRRKAKEIAVHCEEPVAWTLDGEKIAPCNDAAVRNIHNAVRIAVPKSND